MALIGGVVALPLFWTWGSVGKQQLRPATIALLVSASITVFASLSCEGAPRDEDIAPDEVTTSDEDRKWPEGLTVFDVAGPNYGYDPSGPASYNALSVLVPTHAPPAYVPPSNCASVIGCYVPNPRYFDAELEADALEYQTLLASLSPGVRATYRAWLRDRADARAKEREREAAERERDEAEYAVFIEEHLRRLNTGRSAKQ